MNLLLDNKLYLELSYLLPVKVFHENSLYRDEILKVAKKGRSSFVVEEGTKLGRLIKNIKIGSVLSEIPVENVFEMAFGIETNYARDLHVYKVHEKKKIVK
jgi:hypothetical protein